MSYCLNSNSQQCFNPTPTKTLSPHYFMTCGTDKMPIPQAGKMPTPHNEEIDSKSYSITE